jgi:hypothetical protein
MTGENNETEKKITIIRRVSWNGSACPDGADCPALIATSWGTRLTVGRLVTPEVLPALGLPSGEVAIETPGELWAGDAGHLPQAVAGGMEITAGRLVTDPEVLAMLNLPSGEVAIETPGALQEA